MTTNGSDGNGGDGNNPPFTPPPPALLVHVIDDDPEMLAGIEIRQQVSPSETVAIGKRLNKAGCMNLVSLVMDAMCRVTIVSNRAGFKAVH